MEHTKLVELVEQMTLDEKIGQLMQLTGDFYSDKAEERTGPMSQLGLTETELNNAGTILGVAGAAECKRIQRSYMERHRLHIPTLFMADVIHGCRTIFPIPLGLGCSWDPSAAETMARVSAEEAAASGIAVTFSPMVDLVRDPRWGRVMESTGEDPWLNGLFAAAMVRGYQGADDEELRTNRSRVAACVKHFAAYGAPVGGRDYNTVDMSERLLRDMYLPGYRAAIDAGAKLVMTSFNTVDGVPASGNAHLFRDILREEFGFNGVVISDFGAVKEMIAHGVAGDEREAARLAIKAGVDIEMMTVCYLRHLRGLIESGEVAESLLDEAVLRVLELKNTLGLFEHPFRGADEQAEATVVFSDAHRQAAKAAADESIVLLKNDGILPLRSGDDGASSIKPRIAVIGPGAGSHDLLGAWSWRGDPNEATTLAQAMRNAGADAGADVRVGIEPFDPLHPAQSAIDEAVLLAADADAVVLALGETSDMSGEAASRSDIRLPEAQRQLFADVIAVNPNVVVTLCNGRPLDLRDIRDAKAIVEAWFPGTEGAVSLADILFGKINPSGRLTMSFPQTVGQVPVYYNHDNTGRPYEAAPGEKYVSQYLDVSNEPAYPFGFGLSYGHVVYEDARVSSDTFGGTDPLEISVTVHNDSDTDVVETVQLYIRDLVGTVVRPVKQLKGFERVRLAAGERRVVTFTLREEDVRYVHADFTTASDPGDFTIMVGPNSRDVIVAGTVKLVI